jgi:pyruvate/2-oxoglutarate dehydrogenase complex dihydrolipoamide acyltransferase (E2) component
MATVCDIFLEQETANDADGVVVAIHVASGQQVKSGDHLFDVEHSKATMEIRAPADGYVIHDLELSANLSFGTRIGLIVDDVSNDSAPPTIAEKSPAVARQKPELSPIALPDPAVRTSAQRTGARFSKAAAQLAAQHGLRIEDFEGDLLSTDDVRAKLDRGHEKFRPPPNISRQADSSRYSRVERVSARKAEEIRSLSGGASNGAQSVLGVKIGTVRARRESGDIFGGRITDIVVFEASRLMRQFPRLNAEFSDNEVRVFGRINAGVAFDNGSNLVVYGIENSNARTLVEIRREIEDALGRYLEQRLSAEELTRATFVVTDLSASALDYVVPILPSNQSCIIAVTRNARDEFSLHAAFDHRATEGREVALFLEQLSQRVTSFNIGQTPVDLPRCYYCDAVADHPVNKARGGLLRIATPAGDDVYCCGNCWEGH